MLRGGWDAETWKLMKPEIRKALDERRRIERAGWFNQLSALLHRQLARHDARGSRAMQRAAAEAPHGR